MRFYIVRRDKNYKILDIKGTPWEQQETYLVNQETGTIFNIVESSEDFFEILNEFIQLTFQETFKEMITEIKNERRYNK